MRRRIHRLGEDCSERADDEGPHRHRPNDIHRVRRAGDSLAGGGAIRRPRAVRPPRHRERGDDRGGSGEPHGGGQRAPNRGEAQQVLRTDVAAPRRRGEHATHVSGDAPRGGGARGGVRGPVVIRFL